MKDLSETMTDYIACVKTLHDWFHSAHIVAKGKSFAGDHIHIYGRIYEELGEQLDKTFEKILGLSNDEDIVCPTYVAHRVADKMQTIPTTANKDGLMLASIGLQLIMTHLRNTDLFFKVLEENKVLSLGMNDFLSAHCNQLEGYAYLLQQRVKENLR